jgi:hypothetical protein
VVTTTQVADQTDLLSINAAGEAEKAGGHGRGFLVVAREARRLADQTAAATLDIESMVRLAQGAVSAGVLQTHKSSEEVRSGHLVFKNAPPIGPAGGGDLQGRGRPSGDVLARRFARYVGAGGLARASRRTHARRCPSGRRRQFCTPAASHSGSPASRRGAAAW